MAPSRNRSAADAEADTTAADTAVDTTTADEAVEASTTAAPAEVEAPMSELDAPAAEEENHQGKVALKLAHPIENPEHMRRLRLDEKDGGYAVGEKVWLTPDDARAVISAGLAQVDPEDNQAVRDVLTGQTEV